MSRRMVLFEVKNARDSEETPAAMEQVFAALSSHGPKGGALARLLGRHRRATGFSFEVVAANAGVHFFVAVPEDVREYVEGQLTAQYPKLVIQQVADYAQRFLDAPHAIGQLTFASAFYYPIKTYKDVRDLDILASVLGQLAKLPSGDAAAIQVYVEPAARGWQRAGVDAVARGVPDTSGIPGRTRSHPHARIIESKTSQPGFLATVRLVAASSDVEKARQVLRTLAGTFGVFSMGEGNALSLAEPSVFREKGMREAFALRTGGAIPRFQYFGASELASLWHPPGLALSSIKNISWGSRLSTDTPEDLPVATEDEEQKKRVNFFARAEYKNRTVTFGIKKDDRRRHLYIVGKTGTGKSTMIANMAINDMRNGEGVAVIDPHGDLSDILLDYVPSYRINDVAYLDPSDIGYPFHLNPLEIKNEAFRELVASGIVSIFYKLYAHSWGPRLEYILRNTILTLLHVPDTTLLSIPEILTDDRYRGKVVERLPDQVLKNYWMNEYGKMSPQLRSEAVSPILNKVGQFLSSQTIRNIIGSPSSTIDLETAMNEGKIVIVNLSQGKLGEDSSALLGAMMITKFQLAAMNRVYLSEEKRRDFYLYVDEFQNFATDSFIKILSEARKYRLCLTLANQYIGQIDEDVQKAIFGNAGSLVSFGVGAQDAHALVREFGMKYKEEELVGLGNYQIILKLAIDNKTSLPFSAMTLPLPRSRNQGREKIIRSSRERYSRKAKERPAQEGVSGGEKA